MQHSAGQAIVCAVRPHGDVGAIVRCMTEEHGLLAGYVQGKVAFEGYQPLMPWEFVAALGSATAGSGLLAVPAALTL